MQIFHSVNVQYIVKPNTSFAISLLVEFYVYRTKQYKYVQLSIKDLSKIIPGYTVTYRVPGKPAGHGLYAY